MSTASTMQKSPNIIFNLKGFVSGDKSKENDFARCKNSFNIVGYLSRKEAEKRNKDEDLSVLENDYFEVENAWNIASYAALRPGSAGAFSKDSVDLKKEDLAEIMRKLRTTKSTVWTGVLSFTSMTANEFCSSKEQAKALLEEHLPVLFEKSALDYENMEWYAAYHVNTLHPHIHMVFWEKEPTRINSRGKLTYNYNNPTKKPYLPKECLSDFKFSIAKSFEKIPEFYALRDKVRQAVRDDFTNGDYANLLSSLYENDHDIIDKPIKQYARLTKDEQRRIDKSVKALIDANPETRKMYNLYSSLLMQAHMQNIKLLKDNNMPVPERTKKFYDSRMQELKSRLGNEYLKNMKQFALTRTQYQDAKALLMKPFLGQSSSSYMRGVRKIRKPFQSTSNSILKSLEQAVKDEVVVFRNNLDKYFAELKAKGVDLIYGEEERQQAADTDEAFE